MGDEHHRHVPLLLEALEQVEDLGLHGHVERGRGLVGDQELGAARQRDGDDHALPHAAGQLVRVLLQPAGGLGHADRSQQLDGRAIRFLLADVEVVAQRLGDLATDLDHRVQRGHRVLKHHSDLGSPVRAHVAVVEADEVDAVEDHPAGADRVALGQQPHDRAGQHGLARARLTDDADRAAPSQGERHLVDRMHHARGCTKRRREVVDDEEVLRLAVADRARTRLPRLEAGHREVAGSGGAVGGRSSGAQIAASRTSNRARTTSPR